MGHRRGRTAFVAAAAVALAATIAATIAPGAARPASAQSAAVPAPPRLVEGTTADSRLLEAIDWYTGVTGRVDDVRAAALLREAVEGGGPLATMWLARVHSRGRMGFDRDEDTARRLAATVIAAVRALAAAGDVEALFLMGTAFDEALGVAPDPVEALRWYRLAANAGHVLAAHNVGNVHRDGRGVPVDAAAAVGWWLRAARAGDVIPALRLGEAYEAGYGVRADAERGRFWYGRAASAGNADATAALARLRGG